MSDLVEQLRSASGLSTTAVLLVLRGLQRHDWRVVRTGGDTGFSAHQRPDGTWSVHPDSSIHMNGPCLPVEVLVEEWTP